MEEKRQVRGASKHGFRMGYGYVNASEDSEILESNWLYLIIPKVPKGFQFGWSKESM